VVPELSYGDWRQIEAVRLDDRSQFPWIRLPHPCHSHRNRDHDRPRVLLYGFSRGAQVAHRFAMMYHECTGAAVMGAGDLHPPVEGPAQRRKCCLHSTTRSAW